MKSYIMYILGSLIGAIIIVVFERIQSNTKITSTIKSIANNSTLTQFIKNSCIFVQQYCSTTGLTKLSYVVNQVFEQLNNQGVKVSKQDVLQLVHDVYEKNKEEIQSYEFVKDLTTILKEENENG